MSDQGSVAPRERVNIVYRPASGNAGSEVELPLKLLVLGDFTQRDDPTPVEERRPIGVDKDNFDAVLRAQHLQLALTLPNRLAAAGATANVDLVLKFNALADFGPDALVEQIPALRRLIELREALKALKGPLGNIPAFRRKVQELVADAAVRAQLLAELGIADSTEEAR